MAISLILLLTRKQKQGAFTDWAWTFAGILYVGWLLSYLVALRGLDDGRSWVFLAIFATFGSDSAAYFIGRAFGKHKLAPTISPSKTWEGAIGGLVGAAAVSLLFLLPTPVTTHCLSQLVAANYCWFADQCFRATGRPGRIIIQTEYRR